MAYGFKDFGQKATQTSLSIRSIIDGVELEKTFNSKAFRLITTSVAGRGTVTYRTEVSEVFGKDGAMPRGHSLSTRTIVIRAYVRAETNEDYREGMSKLNAMLASGEIRALKFTDDTAHTYYGICQRVEDDGEKSNAQFVEIEFMCADPYKYTAEKTISTTNSKALTVDTHFEVVPEEIKIVFNSATDAKSFSMNNTTTGNRIVFESPSTASSATITIRQKDDYIGYTASVNHIEGLNVRQSHFDEFAIKTGDRLVVTPAPKEIQLKYEGAKL